MITHYPLRPRHSLGLISTLVFALSWLMAAAQGQAPADSLMPPLTWEPLGLSGGGGLFAPAISTANPNLMMLNCDMSTAYVSEDGGRNWRMVHQAQLRSDTRCRPAFHPADPRMVFASSGGRLRVSPDRGRTFVPIGDLRDSLLVGADSSSNAPWEEMDGAT